MNQESEFPFERARRVTPAEHQEFRAALVEKCRVGNASPFNVYKYLVLGWRKLGLNLFEERTGDNRY